MIDEIKKNALKILEKQCPDELEIYNRWERCISMYAAGFRSVPQSMEEILKWYNCDVPYDHGYRVGKLLVCLRFVNSAISSGASRKWSDKILSRTCSPQQRVFAELLYELNTHSEEQRLEVARQDFLKSKSVSERASLLEYYGIDDTTLDAWISETPPGRPISKGYFIRTDDELRTSAIQKLVDRNADEQGAFFNVDEAVEFYDHGCRAAELAIVQDWKREYCPPATWRMFKHFNELLKNNSPSEKIQALLSHMSEDARPVMELLLECAEEMRRDE